MASPRGAQILAELGRRASHWASDGRCSVAESQCRRSRTAEISCQSSARTQSKGAVANGVLASPCDVLVCAIDCVSAALCCSTSTVGSTAWHRDTRHRFLAGGMQNRIARMTMALSLWRWQVGMGDGDGDGDGDCPWLAGIF